MTCKNCGTAFHSKYCPNCGHPANLKRIDSHYIIHEIEHVLHFERGILYTIRELATNPGDNVRNYLSENRSRLIKPIIFIIITSLIYTILSHFFHVDEYVKYHEAQGENPTAVSWVVKWVQEHYGYANLMMGILTALWLKLFFRRYDFNFYEVLIMLCFVMGMGMLIFSVFVIVQGITHLSVMTYASVLGVVYCAWAIGQFYAKKKASSYIKGLLAYILGMISFWIIPILIGTIIDLINKH